MGIETNISTRIGQVLIASIEERGFTRKYVGAVIILGTL